MIITMMKLFSSQCGRVDETNRLEMTRGLMHAGVVREGVRRIEVATHLLDPNSATEHGVLHPELTTL